MIIIIIFIVIIIIGIIIIIIIGIIIIIITTPPPPPSPSQPLSYQSCNGTAELNRMLQQENSELLQVALFPNPKP